MDIHLFDSSKLEHLRPILTEAEDIAHFGIGPTLNILRKLSLTDFGERLLHMPDPDYPEMSKVLPRALDPQRAAAWTGGGGHEQLQDSLSFIRILREGYERYAARKLTDASVVDFGCGFGRLMRLMLYYVEPDRLNGLDPAENSLSACTECGVPGNILKTDHIPLSLPLPDQYDLIYSYSVFTHLSKRSTLACINAIRGVIADDGILCLTIRPVEFWKQWGPSNGLTTDEIRQAQSDHATIGFGFHPVNMPPVDGDIPFGTTSMTFEWIEANFPFRILGYDRGLDFSQTILFLKPT